MKYIQCPVSDSSLDGYTFEEGAIVCKQVVLREEGFPYENEEGESPLDPNCVQAHLAGYHCISGAQKTSRNLTSEVVNVKIDLSKGNLYDQCIEAVYALKYSDDEKATLKTA